MRGGLDGATTVWPEDPRLRSPLCKCGAPLSGHAVAGQYDGGCWETRCDSFEAADVSPLSVLLALTDATGSTLRVERDSRDGRTYLTVAFDGHESPFEIDPTAAEAIAGALRPLSGAVVRAAFAVKTGST